MCFCPRIEHLSTSQRPRRTKTLKHNFLTQYIKKNHEKHIPLLVLAIRLTVIHF